MSRLNRFRNISRMVGILSGVGALAGIAASLTPLAVTGAAVLILDIVLIAVKNRCPFCHKGLRIAPIGVGEEFCPHCGCKIE